MMGWETALAVELDEAAMDPSGRQKAIMAASAMTIDKRIESKSPWPAEPFCHARPVAGMPGA
jgi:hypothetical protein